MIKLSYEIKRKEQGMSRPRYWYYKTVERLIFEGYQRGRVSEQLTIVNLATADVIADIDKMPNGEKMNEIIRKLLLEQSESVHSIALKYYIAESQVIKLKATFIYRVANYLGFSESEVIKDGFQGHGQKSSRC